MEGTRTSRREQAMLLGEWLFLARLRSLLRAGKRAQAERELEARLALYRFANTEARLAASGEIVAIEEFKDGANGDFPARLPCRPTRRKVRAAAAGGQARG